MPLNDDIADALTRHQIGLQRLSNATIRKIVALLNRLNSRILERLAEGGGSSLSRARQEALLEDIRRIVDSVYKDATGQLQIDLEKLAVYENDYQLDMFRRLIPVELDTVSPSANQIIAAVNSRPFQGRLLREWYAGIAEDASRRLRETIRMGFVEGRTSQQMVRDIVGTRANGFKDGILEINRRGAAAIVRTAVNHTATAARNETFRANSRLIKGLQWSSTLDNRTTMICMARDGQVYPIDKGPRPPAHIGCRSSMIPVLKSARALDIKNPTGFTRASMNGQVAEELNYSEWLRRQPAAFQDDVLGKAKGKLFRNGGLAVDRFVDNKGREYTLDELKRREAEAWEKAFA